MKRPTCPKCGKKNMVANARTAGGKVRWTCYTREGNQKVFCYSSTDPESAPRQRNGKRSQKVPVFKRSLGKVERYIVTAAQNGTPIHKGFLKTLETACNALSAELLVIPFRYKNPTSDFSASQANEDYWAAEVQPYLWNTRKSLNRNIMVMGDIKTQPTATTPLTGFDAISHGESGIFGHTKLQLRSIPVAPGKHPKILTTTGACTIPNYTDSKAGKLGDFHHTLGAALVEVRGDIFHLRQVNAEKATGAFIDLDRRYDPDGVSKAPRALALSMGDTHVDEADPSVIEATFGKGGIVELLDPEVLAWHDLLNGGSVSHHDRGRPFLAIDKRRNGGNDAEAEVKRAIAFLDRYTKGRKSILVPSNHDDFLQRWLEWNDWRTDPANAEFYLQSALAMVQAVKGGADANALNVFGYWVKKLLGHRKEIIVLDPDQSYEVAGIELALHGDDGPNGSRGSLKNLRRIGKKVIIGHSHTEGIDEGGYQNGTSSILRPGYTIGRGPSSWTNSHTTIYANGKRCLLRIINGEYRL